MIISASNTLNSGKEKNIFASVGIVIVNWNGFVHTDACLNSLKKLAYPNFKTFVVDNGSQDGSGQELVKNHEDFAFFIFNEKNTGFTGGNNSGILEVIKQGFDYVMLLNNDTEVESDFLDHLVSAIEADDSLGAVQPKFFFLNDKSRIWNAGGKFFPWLGISKTIGYNRLDRPDFNKPKGTDWITGCGFLVSIEVVKKVGILNDKFFIYYEDVDWSFRIRQEGYSLGYVPKSIVYHEAGMSNKSKTKGKEGFLSPFVHYLGGRNQVWLLRKYTPWYFAPTVSIYMILRYLFYALYFFIRKRFKKLTFMLRGLKEGIFYPGV
jgi:GT2 family glycosyltransferase